MEGRQSRLSNMDWKRFRPYLCVRLIPQNSMFSNFCHVLNSPLFIAFLLLVSSCTSKTDKAQEIVRDFSKALSNVDSIAIKRIYPSSASFFNLFPTMGDIDEISAKEDGDYILVDCKSGHYDEHSHFVQSKFSCWVKDEDGKLIISDSKGLITLPEEFGTYPYEIGAVTKYSKDVELGNKYYCCPVKKDKIIYSLQI